MTEVYKMLHGIYDNICSVHFYRVIRRAAAAGMSVRDVEV